MTHLRRAVLIVLAVLCCGVSVRAQAEADTAPPAIPTDVVLLDWGDAASTVEDELLCPGPEWWLGAWKRGGSWIWDLSLWFTGWQPVPAEGLYIALDRNLLPGNVVLEVLYCPYNGADLAVDLINWDHAEVTEDVVGPLGTSASPGMRRIRASLPLADHEEADVIRLRRLGAGEVAVFESLLYTGLVVEGVEVQENESGAANASFASRVRRRGESTLSAEEGTAGQTPSVVGEASTQAITEQSATGTASSGQRVIWVDARAGNDDFDGLSRSQAGQASGPKRTVSAARAIVRDGDVVRIRGGHYRESVSFCGLDVDVFYDGDGWF